MSTRFFTFFLPVFTSFYVNAQDSIPVSSLNEVIVTAIKYPVKQTETGKVVTVINREQLAQSNGKTIAEVLNTSVGTTIIGANSNYGTNLNVSIRGSSAGNVLILMDGIPVNDPSVISNYYDLNFLSVEQIERIEILKGGQSTLYGSDAVAGVINIITRKAGKNSFGGNVEIAAGSYGTIKGNAGFSGRKNKTAWGLQYGWITSDGFSSAYDSAFTRNFDNDGYTQHSLTGHYHFNITDKLKAQLNGNLSRYITDLDAASFTDELDYTGKNLNYQFGTGLTYDVNKMQLKLNYRYNYVSRDYLDDSLYKSSPFVSFSESSFKGKTHFAELLMTRNSKNTGIIAGIDYRQNRMEQESFYLYSFGPSATSLSDSLAHISQFSGFTSVVVKNNSGGSFEAGGRWNHHSAYGNNFTYTINPSYLFSNRLKLFANFYSSYKTPTLYQLFDHTYGNVNLQPEKSQWIEGGIQLFPSGETDIRMVYFKRKTNDVIQFIYTDLNTFEAEYSNMGTLKSSGLEGEFSFSNKLFNVSLNATYTKGKITSAYDETGSRLDKDTSYNNVYRIPEFASNVRAGVNVTKKWNITASLRYVGERPEPVYASAPIWMDEYLVADIYSSFAFSKKLKVFADFKNITDELYFDQSGYTTRRFNVMAGVVVNW